MRALFSQSARAGLAALAPHAPLLGATAALATLSTWTLLGKTGGEPAVPLDDAFIHFQFARSLVELHPLAYTPGATPTPGATSLLWPLLLAPFYAVGLRDTSIIWVAWLLSWSALALLAHETRRMADRICSPANGIAAEAMVLLFGGYVWFAGSGMEVVPFTWLLMRTARRVAEWGEADGAAVVGKQAAAAGEALDRTASETPDEASTKQSWSHVRIELCVLGILTPLMRPEGALASLLAAVALLLFPRGASRAWALVPLTGPGLFSVANLLLAGQAATTTMQVKWLPASPYRQESWQKLSYNVDLLVHVLLDGRVWSRVFLPAGGKIIAWLVPFAIALAGWRRGCWWRATVVLAVAAGITIPTTYDSFLVNRLRYLWPFAAAWFVGLAALADAVGAACARVRPALGSMRLLVAGGFVGALAGQLSPSLEDLAVSAAAIHKQQVGLGRWARNALPPGSLIGVNDAGAIAYLSGQRTFDVVGLTTAGEATHWVAGAGSRFEHYEHLGPNRLPTHFIVYDSWFGIPALLGEYLTHRTVGGATILGDTTKTAYRARYAALGSAARPTTAGGPSPPPLDTLDVADLQSEAAHRYELFRATQADNVALQDAQGRVDGARQARTLERFELQLAPGGQLVARLAAGQALSLRVEIDANLVGTLELIGAPTWEEPQLRLPNRVPAGRRTVTLRAPDGTSFTALHYWSYR
jgi:hypothetical protein